MATARYRATEYDNYDSDDDDDGPYASLSVRTDSYQSILLPNGTEETPSPLSPIHKQYLTHGLAGTNGRSMLVEGSDVGVMMDDG